MNQKKPRGLLLKYLYWHFITNSTIYSVKPAVYKAERILMDQQTSKRTRHPKLHYRRAACWGIRSLQWSIFNSYKIDSAWVTAIRMLTAGILLMAGTLAGRKMKLSAVLKDKKDACRYCSSPGRADSLPIRLFKRHSMDKCRHGNRSAESPIVFIAAYVCITTQTPPTKKSRFVSSLHSSAYGLSRPAAGRGVCG